jgi:hypothetical protein
MHDEMRAKTGKKRKDQKEGGLLTEEVVNTLGSERRAA